MADRAEMIRQLKRREMIAELKSRDSQNSDPTGEGAATLAAEEKYASEKPGVLEAANLGSVQGGLKNWGDEAISKVTGWLGGDEEQMKHKIRQRDDRARAEQPEAYYAANIPMRIATSASPAGVGKSMLLAGAEGVASSLGDAKKLDGDAAKDAAVTGSIDAATAGVLAKVAPSLLKAAKDKGADGMSWLSDFLKGQSNKQYVKALGGNKAQYKALGDKVQDVGNMVRENKIVTPMASSKEIYERLDKQGEDIAKQMAPIYKASSKSKVSSEELEQMIRDRSDELLSEPGTIPKGEQVAKYADNVNKAATRKNAAPNGARQTAIRDLEAIGGDAADPRHTLPGVEFNPTDIKQFRRQVQDGLNYNSDIVSQQGGKEVRSLLREKEMSLIENVDPELRAANEKLFRDQHLNILAEDAAKEGAIKSAVNNEIGMNTWHAMQAGAAATQSGPVAIATGIARELVRRYGNQMSGAAMYAASQAIAKSKFAPFFEEAAKKGPAGIAAVHAALQGNPEYQALIGDK